jgi:hypothetical protein
MGAAVAATTRIANIMNDVLQEQRDARMDAQVFRASTKAPKSVGEFFKAHMTNKLMVLCHVASEADLPDLWAAIAEANGKREREAIEVVVREMANGLGWDELSPVITPQLAKKLSTLRLAGSNLDDLEEGVSPFSIVIMDHTSAGEKAYHDALTAANDYDDLMKGSSAVDLNDLKALKQVKILIPETFSTARAMLQSFRVLLMCMIEDAHAISRNYTRFLGNYIGKENFYNGRIQRADPKLGPARLLRYVQLHMRAWFHNIGMANDLVTAGDVTPPKLMEALEKTTLGDMSWLPDLPPQYLKSANNTPNRIPDDPRSKAVQVANPSKNVRFEDFRVGISKTKFNDAIRKVGEPPKVVRNGKEVPMCASYHLRGMCFNNCSRQADHVKHTDAEDELLYNWCKKAFVE